MSSVKDLKQTLARFWNRRDSLTDKERRALREHRVSVALQRDLMSEKIKDLERSIADSCSQGVMVPESTCVKLWKSRHMQRNLSTLVVLFDRLVETESQEKEDRFVQDTNFSR